MPLDYVDEVLKLSAVKNPIGCPTPADWVRVEAETDRTFPANFKTLVTSLGTGCFGAGLSLRNPLFRTGYGGLSHAALIKYRESISDLVASSNMLFYPAAQGLVNISNMDRQDFLLRPDTRGRILKEAELIWWSIETGEVKELHLSLPQFIHDLYFGLIKEPWSDELRTYFWRNGALPFFTPSKKS